MKNIYKSDDAYAEDVVEHHMATYAKFSVNAQFASVVDGLTKVHRRILNVFLNKEKNEVQKIIYWAAKVQQHHPHNEVSIEETLAMMMQSFIYHIPFFESHGHSGSYVDNKGADGRYLRCSSSDFIFDMYNDYEPAAIKYRESDSGNGFEKMYYIPKIPMALCLRVVGIATGFSTSNLPSHIDSICKLALWYCRQSDESREHMAMTNAFPSNVSEYLLPDVPIRNTLITRTEYLKRAYEEGDFEHKIVLEGDMNVGDKHITIHTIPYNREYEGKLDKFIQDLKNKTYPELSNALDTFEDDVNGKESARLELQFKRKYNPFDFIDLIKRAFGFRMIFTPNSYWLSKENVSMKVGPGQILDSWFRERERALYIKFNKDQERLFKILRRLEAILIVKDDIDEVVEAFKTYETKKEVIDFLIVRFQLSQYQANEISQMRLEHIIKENREDITIKINELNDQIASIKNKLLDITAIMESDILSIQKKYGSLKSKTIYPVYIGYATRDNENGMLDVVLLKDKDIIPNDFKIFIHDENHLKYLYRIGANNKFENNHPLHFSKYFQTTYITGSDTELDTTIVLDKNDQNTIFRQNGLTWLNEPNKKVIYTKDKILTLSNTGILRAVDVNEFPLRASIKSLGNQTKIIDIHKYIKAKKWIVFYINTTEPGIVRVMMATDGQKINILTGGETEIFVYPENVKTLILTFPDYMYVRQEKRPFDLSRIDKDEFNKLKSGKIKLLKINIAKQGLLPKTKYKEY